ncbi:MAG: hypothetical protein ABI889_04600 [Gemmatimonadota bacterium]
MARHEPPDHSRGDERTLGGYMAVHARPAAFEGADRLSYSVGIETDETGDPTRPIGGYLLFVRWGGEQPEVTGHIESPFLAWGATVEDVTHAIGALSLHEVKRQLDLLVTVMAPSSRPWWEVMREEGTEHDG